MAGSRGPASTVRREHAQGPIEPGSCTVTQLVSLKSQSFLHCVKSSERKSWGRGGDTKVVPGQWQKGARTLFLLPLWVQRVSLRKRGGYSAGEERKGQELEKVGRESGYKKWK